MSNGLWTAVSGAVSQAQAVDLVANNLANADTTGFKKDEPAFKEYLSTVEAGLAAPKDIPRGPIKDKDFYPTDGKENAHVITNGTYTSFKPGAFKLTHSPLDVALEGPGFLEVSTPSGVRYTKVGALKIAADGKLVNSDGYPVLASPQPNRVLASAGAAPTTGNLAERFISLKDVGPRISILESGEILNGDTAIAKLSVVEFPNLNQLRKEGGGLFGLQGNNPPQSVVASNTQVRQGMLEGSNVNPVEEMTNLIKANRLFEHDMKAIKTFGEMMGREVNDIGKL